jgi:hypothetical protein
MLFFWRRIFALTQANGGDTSTKSRLRRGEEAVGQAARDRGDDLR